MTTANRLNEHWDQLCSSARADGLSQDDTLAIQVLPAEVLIAAAAGRLDLNALARATLANRGLDQAGRWVGFDAAADALLGKFARAAA